MSLNRSWSKERIQLGHIRFVTRCGPFIEIVQDDLWYCYKERWSSGMHGFPIDTLGVRIYLRSHAVFYFCTAWRKLKWRIGLSVCLHALSKFYYILLVIISILRVFTIKFVFLFSILKLPCVLNGSCDQDVWKTTQRIRVLHYFSPYDQVLYLPLSPTFKYSV